MQIFSWARFPVFNTFCLMLNRLCNAVLGFVYNRFCYGAFRLLYNRFCNGTFLFLYNWL